MAKRGLAGGVSGGPDPTEGFRRASTLGALLALLDVKVELKTCRTIHGTHLEGILSQKKWTGLAGGVKNVCATLDSTVSVWATLNNNVAYLCYYTMYNIGLEGLLFTLRV